jgi:hypothetical protein
MSPASKKNRERGAPVKVRSAEPGNADYSDSSALALRKKYTRLQALPLTIKFENIEITKAIKEDFASILSDPNDALFSEAWNDMVAVVHWYRLSAVDGMAKPALIYKALNELRQNIRAVENGLPSLMILRAELRCFAKRLSWHIDQIKAVKGKNQKTAPATFAKMMLGMAFSKHVQRIPKAKRQERWEKYLDFVLALGEIPHPDPKDPKAPGRWKAFAGKLVNPAGSQSSVEKYMETPAILDYLMPRAKTGQE